MNASAKPVRGEAREQFMDVRLEEAHPVAKVVQLDRLFPRWRGGGMEGRRGRGVEGCACVCTHARTHGHAGWGMRGGVTSGTAGQVHTLCGCVRVRGGVCAPLSQMDNAVPPVALSHRRQCIVPGNGTP